MAEFLRRALASALAAAVIVVSPGLEAYAAEGRVAPITVTTPVNAAGATVKPLSLPGATEIAGQTQRLGLPSTAVPDLQTGANLGGASVELGASAAATNAPQAGLMNPAGGENAAAAPAVAAQTPLVGAPAETLAPEGVASDAAPEAPIAAIKGAERVADARGIAANLRSLKSAFSNKVRQSLIEPVSSLFRSDAPAKSPEAKLSAAPAQAPPAEAAAGVPAAAPTQSGPTAEDGGAQPPAPPSKPSDGGGKGKSSPWRNAYVFIAGLIVAQVGVEAWSAAWAKWVQTNFNTPHFDAYATVTMVAMGTSLVAGFVGGWLTDKLGLKRTFIGTMIGIAVMSGVLLSLFSARILTVATPGLLIGLTVARAFMNSANGTAQQTVPIAIFKDDKAAFQKYNSSSQFILEIAGIAVPYGIGALLGLFGFVGTMWIMPVALAASAVLLMAFLKIAEVKKAKKDAPAKDNPTDPGLLKIAMSGYPALVLLNYLLYAVIAIGYGNFLHPGAAAIEQAAASGAAGKIVSLYSAGGLIAAAILSGVPAAAWKWLRSKWGWLDKKSAAVQAKLTKGKAADDDPHADAKSAAKWLILSAIGLAGFIPLLWSSPMLAALAMIPFGITNVMSTLQLISIAQSNTPQSRKGKVMGVIRTISTALATAGIYAFSKLFKLYPGSHFPFVVFLGLCGVLAAYYVFTSIRLRRHIASHQAGPQTAPQK